ncbi:putative Cu-dependent DNA-binding protein [Aspergillus undulatus]|uniref:putative Cu-dependent DNA-binding protein n=1 Tax=Aspergillus undulatus TaxID=1810928 RepID=UPI003CCE0B75
MLIDGEKWACEACVRGHRVSTCKHNDRPLTRINRKGRPFSTCSICNCTPCNSPEEHTKLKREAELKAQAQNRASAGGRYARSSPPALLPLAPRPSASASPPSSISANQSSSRQGYSRGSRSSSDTAAPATRAKGSAPTGGRGTPQGAPHHRTNPQSPVHASSARSGSGTSARSSQQHYYTPPSSQTHYGGLSPLSMPFDSFSPPLCSMSDFPVTLSMASPFDHLYGDPALLDGSGGAAAFPSLEDLDLDGYQDDLGDTDWRWFSDHDVQ